MNKINVSDVRRKLINLLSTDEEIKTILSYDYDKEINVDKRFYANGEYSPFVIYGFDMNHDEAEKILKLIDEDLYVAGSFGGSGLEISRYSFWLK